MTATAALFVAVGGGAYAAIGGIPDRGGVFHGCANKRTGALRVVKSDRSCTATRKRHGRIVSPGEFAIAWNQQGRPGVNGINGINGANGTARAYGRVAQDGTLTRSKNAVVTHAPASNIYCITPAAGIDPDTSVLVATPDHFGDDTVFGGAGNNNEQAVVEWRSAGGNCAAGQMEVRTGKRAQSSGTPVNSVDLIKAEEAFAFLIP